MNLMFFLILFIIFWYRHSVSGEKYEILKVKEKPWLTKKFMAIILNYSFPESRCCNIYINNNISEEEYRLFKSFVSVYQEGLYLRRKNFDCSDYLLIASHDFQIIDYFQSLSTAKSTNRIIILIDSTLQEDSKLFNVSFYNNSNVIIICRSGNYILSENYLEPRSFQKVNRLKKMETKFQMINLKGRELQASTFFNPPFCFLRTTVNKTVNGIPVQMFLTNNRREIDGIELHLFMIIAKAFNFSYRLRSPTGRYKHGRKFNDTTWDSGMINQVIEKEVHIAFGSIWISLDNYVFTNLTEPWTQVFIHFLVPRPKAYTSFWALTRPLSPAVWFFLVSVLSLQSMCIYGKAWINPLVPRYFRNFIITFTEMMGRMLGTWLPVIPPSLRLNLVLWELAGFIMVTAYCSSLAARLTNPEFEERIDTVKQFIETNLTWGREGNAPQYHEYFDMEDRYGKQIPSRFILEKSVEDRNQLLLQGNHAVIGRIVGNVYYPENYVTYKALENLRVMKQTVGKFYTGFAVQPWLLKPINEIMMRLKESGIVLYHMENVIHRRTGASLREVFIEHDNIDFNRAIVLAINPLGVGFATLIFGLIVASLVFYLELRSIKENWNLRQIFHMVKNKIIISEIFRSEK